MIIWWQQKTKPAVSSLQAKSEKWALLVFPSYRGENWGFSQLGRLWICSVSPSELWEPLECSRRVAKRKTWVWNQCLLSVIVLQACDLQGMTRNQWPQTTSRPWNKQFQTLSCEAWSPDNPPYPQWILSSGPKASGGDLLCSIHVSDISFTTQDQERPSQTSALLHPLTF